MNCKEGDLAIVVKSHAGNEGKIVTCLKWVGRGTGLTGDYTDVWLVDQALNWRNKRTGEITKIPYYIDQWLRPIPKQELLEDEQKKEVSYG